MGTTTLEKNASEVKAETPGTEQAPQLVPVIGDDGKPLTSVKLPNGIIATVRGKDPTTGNFILTCADTEANRQKYPSQPKKVQNVRATNPTIAGNVQYYRNETGELTITIPGGKKGNESSTKKELDAQIKRHNCGLMHIVSQTKAKEAEQAQAQAEKEETWSDISTWGWKKWLIVIAATLGIAAIGYFGFRKGGWFRSDKKSKVTPNTPVTPENPGQTMPDHEDDYGNTTVTPNTPTPSLPETKPMDTTTNTGGSTVIQGGSTQTIIPGQVITADRQDPISGPSIRDR